MVLSGLQKLSQSCLRVHTLLQTKLDSLLGIIKQIIASSDKDHMIWIQ